MTNRAKRIIIAVAVMALCVLFLVGVMVGAAVIGWKAATRAGNEAATIQNLKAIAAVEVQYFNTHNRTFGTLDQLRSEQFLNSKFAGNPTVADGYVLKLTVAQEPDGKSRYKITADPQNELQGTSHFYVDSDDDSIHVNSERQAGPGDPAL
jgi:hypothetical protein